MTRANSQGYVAAQEGMTNSQTTWCVTNYIMTPYFLQESAWKVLTNERHVFHNPSSADSMVVTKAFEYDSGNQLPVRVIETDAGGAQRTTDTSYGFRQYAGMETLNMLVQPYQVTIREGGSAGTVRARSWTLWANTWASVQGLNKSNVWVNTWMPSQTWTWNGSGTVPTTPSSTNSVRSMTFDTYDGYGRVTKQTDARNTAREFFFGTNLSKFSNTEQTTGFRNSFLTGVRLTSGTKTFQVEYAYVETGANWGLASQSKDEGAVIRNYTYDTHRRLSRIADGASLALWDYAYLVSSTSPSYVRTTKSLDGTLQVISTQYVDGLGRPNISEAQDGTRYIVSLTQYDAQGRPWRNWLPYMRSTSGAYSTTDAVTYYNGSTTVDVENFDRCAALGSTPSVETTYLADPLNRVASSKSPYCGTQTAIANYAYGVETNRLFETRTGEEGRQTKTLTDGWGRRTRSINGFGTAAAATTNFTYNVLDKLTQVTDTRSLQTTYVYDGLSRMTSKTSPDAGLVQFKYNNASDLRYRRDARQNDAAYYRVSYMQYDGFGRQTLIGEAGASPTAYAALNGNTTATFEATTSNWITVHQYDAKPSTTVFPWNIAAFSSTITAALMNNLDSRLAATAHRSDGAWQLTLYSYDANGYLTMKQVVTDGSSALTTTHNYTLNRHGEPTRIHTQVGSNNWYQWFDYNARGLLSAVSSSTTSTKPAADVTYVYTASGQVRKESFQGTAAIPKTYTITDWLATIDNLASPVLPTSKTGTSRSPNSTRRRVPRSISAIGTSTVTTRGTR